MRRIRTSWLRWHLYLIAGLLLISAAIPSAAQSPEPEGTAARQQHLQTERAKRGDPLALQPLIQHITRGEVHVVLQTDRQRMRMTDQLQLHLSIRTPPDTVVAFPQAAETLGPFRIVQQALQEPRAVAPYTQEWQQSYMLEAERAGSLTIPSLTITWQAKGDAEPQMVQTPPQSITVTSVLPDDADVTAPKDIAPPVVLPRRGLPLWLQLLIGALAALCLLTALWWWYRRRRRPEVTPTPQPAHLIALEALRQLQRDDLIMAQRIDEFYVRLSTIVRRYVEWRFGLRAPEQTTEEFLAAAHATGYLIAMHRDLLGTFLQQCDLVKFARHQPSPGDMQRAWESAKNFVEQTADEHTLVPVTGAEV